MIDTCLGGYGPKIPKIVLDKVKKLTREGNLKWVNDCDPSADYPKAYKALQNKIEYKLYFTPFGWVLMIIQDDPWVYERYEIGRLAGFWLARLIKKSTKSRKTNYELKLQNICNWMEEHK